jgi:hypothetical protein
MVLAAQWRASVLSLSLHPISLPLPLAVRVLLAIYAKLCICFTIRWQYMQSFAFALPSITARKGGSRPNRFASDKIRFASDKFGQNQNPGLPPVPAPACPIQGGKQLRCRGSVGHGIEFGRSSIFRLPTIFLLLVCRKNVSGAYIVSAHFWKENSNLVISIIDFVSFFNNFSSLVD